MDTEADKHLIHKLAHGLTVRLAREALFVASAGFASTAAHATSAQNADRAEHAATATLATTAEDANNLGGQPASAYLAARHFVTSGGVHFYSAGQEGQTLLRVGAITISVSCTDVNGGNVVAFDATSSVANADLDGNGPQPAGFVANIHTNSDVIDGKQNGEFDQVGSASDSTEILPDGTEVDIFYTDGVNYDGHDCFAGATGFVG